MSASHTFEKQWCGKPNSVDHFQLALVSFNIAHITRNRDVELMVDQRLKKDSSCLSVVSNNTVHARDVEPL